MRHDQARGPCRSRSTLRERVEQLIGEQENMKAFSAPLRVSASPREPRPGTVGRRGFTLVEMLVVVAIIGILASTLLGALFVATEHARAERTKSLISKLHNQMMQRWEEYETRRVPLMAIGATSDAVAFDQYIFRNEIMRMELPDTYEDLNLQYNNPFDAPQVAALKPYSFEFMYRNPSTPPLMPGGGLRPDPNSGTNECDFLPAITRAYHQRVLSAINAVVPSRYPTEIDALEAMIKNNQSAEMLYLIMTTASGDEDSGGIHFSAKDEGDTDGDGMLEFLDAWGNPIEWIRWPAGFANVDTTTLSGATTWGYVTDLIGNVPDDDPTRDVNDATDPDVTDIWLDDPDPFDPRFVRSRVLPAPISDSFDVAGTPTEVRYGFRLTPLIMSPGPDGEYGVVFRSTATANNSDPYLYWSDGPIYRRKGTPIKINLTTGDPDEVYGEWVHLDNITNHLTEAE